MNHMYVCIQCNYMYIVYIICMIRIYMFMRVCARKFIQHISGQTGNGIWLDLRHYLTISTCFLPEKSESPDEIWNQQPVTVGSGARNSLPRRASERASEGTTSSPRANTSSMTAISTNLRNHLLGHPVRRCGSDDPIPLILNIPRTRWFSIWY